MYDLIKKLIKAIITLFGIAAAQAAVEELDKYAYPSSRRRYSRYNAYSRFGYSRYPYSTRPYSGPTRNIFEKEERRQRAEAGIDFPEERVSIRENNRSRPEGFADVLMVAFDLSGPNKEATHEWLMNQMPATGEHPDHEIDLDAWWIADDGCDDSDCDSAVFVPKGQQDECRQLLAKHNFRLNN